jgi:hypothetical protein
VVPDDGGAQSRWIGVDRQLVNNSCNGGSTCSWHLVAGNANSCTAPLVRRIQCVGLGLPTFTAFWRDQKDSLGPSGSGVAL